MAELDVLMKQGASDEPLYFFMLPFSWGWGRGEGSAWGKSYQLFVWFYILLRSIQTIGHSPMITTSFYQFLRPLHSSDLLLFVHDLLHDSLDCKTKMSLCWGDLQYRNLNIDVDPKLKLRIWVNSTMITSIILLLGLCTVL